MRFAAAPIQQPEHRSAAVDFIRRLAAPQDAAPEAPNPPPVQGTPAELPAELDQRVRLVGEW